MAVGRAMAVPEVGETALVVESDESGMLVPRADPATLMGL